jgi:hypothetical protein
MTQDVGETALTPDQSAPPEAEAPKEDAPKVEEASSSQGEDPKKKLGGWQRKLLKRDTVISAQAAEIERLRKIAASTQAPPQAPPPIDPNLPWEQQQEVLVDRKVDDKLAQRQRAQEIEALKQQDLQRLQDNKMKWEASAAEIRQARPDFDQVLAKYHGPNDDHIWGGIMSAGKPAEVALYIAENPHEAFAMRNMKLTEVYDRIDQIEDKLEQAKSPAAKTTNAPPPVNPVKASAKTNQSEAPDDPDEFREWDRKRRAKR